MDEITEDRPDDLVQDGALLALATMRGVAIEGGPDLERSAAVLAADTTPLRLTWKGLLATQEPDRPDEVTALAPQLAESLVRRARPDVEGDVTGLAADLVGVTSRVLAQNSSTDWGLDPEQFQQLLGPFLGDAAAGLAWSPCNVTFRKPGPGEGPGSIFCVPGRDTYSGTVRNVSASIEPLNWPRCSPGFFLDVEVVPGTFAVAKDMPGPKGRVTRSFTCDYIERVLLPTVVKGGGWPVPMQPVTTRLTCRHWIVVDKQQDVVEAGMSYDLGSGPGGDATVTYDSGHAVVTDIGKGMVQVDSLKEIRFAVKDATKSLKSPWMQTLFCTIWHDMFDLTLDACRLRTPADEMQHEVERRSKAGRSKATPPDDRPGDPAGRPDLSWLDEWLADAEDYWDHAAGVAGRQSQRLEQRRSSSEPARTESLFYDALETWEANRPSLREGLDLWVRLLHGVGGDSQAARGGPKVQRHRIDDIEYPDDGARRDTDFVRDRTRAYLEVTRRASQRLADGTYERADLVTDAFDLWGRLARDWTDGLLRGVRTVTRLAEDTPVPQDPRRRVVEQVKVATRTRPLAFTITELVSDTPRADGTTPTISPSDVEISPNPMLRGDPTTVTVAVNASGPVGTYTGELLVLRDDPDGPVARLPVALVLDGRFGRR